MAVERKKLAERERHRGHDQYHDGLAIDTARVAGNRRH